MSLLLSEPVFARHLCTVINTSNMTSVFPICGRSSLTLNIFKIKTNNYRPISILKILSKIGLIEKHVHGALHMFLFNYDLISVNPSGFWKYYSCET